MLTGKRTALFGLVLVVLGALQGFDWITLVTDPTVAGRIVAGIGVAVMVLRAMTSTEMFSDR